MNAKTTLWLTGIAVLLFAFIALDQKKGSADKTANQPLLRDLKPSLVNALHVRRGAGRLEIRAVRTNGQWVLTDPMAYRAQSAGIEALLESLARLSVQGHIPARELKSRPQSQSEFGLDVPQATITLIQGDERKHIVIGTNTPWGGEVYLQVVGMEGIYLGSSNLLREVPRHFNEWREPSLLHLKELEFDRLEIRPLVRHFEAVLDRTNNNWRISRPTSARADNQKINAILKELERWNITRFISDDPAQDFETYGLLTPSTEIALGQGTNDLLVLQFGLQPTNEPSQIYARIKNKPSIFLVPAAPLDELKVDYNKVRDRRLLQVSGVDRIEVRRDGINFHCQYQPNGWRVFGAGVFPGDAGVIQKWLAHLNNVEVNFEQDLVTDFRTKYGLVPPSMEYVFSVAKTNQSGLTNEEMARLQFGTNEIDKIYVRRADENSVYSIKPGDFYQMPVMDWQLRERRLWNFSASNVVSVTIQEKGTTRKLVRVSPIDWAVPGSTAPMNPFSPEETVYQLGNLTADQWVARGDLFRPNFGFKERDHKITIEVKSGEKTDLYSLELGRLSPEQKVYALVYLDNISWMFEMPGPLYKLILRDLSVSSTGNSGQ